MNLILCNQKNIISAFYFVLTILLLPQSIIGSKGIRNRCPPYELLYPCYCNSIPKYDQLSQCSFGNIEITSTRCQTPVITCIGHHLGEKLRTIFGNISEHITNGNYRKFEWFYLIDHGLTELGPSLFEHVYFRNIYLKSCPQLQWLNVTTFGRSNSHYTRNIFINASSLSNEPKLRRSTFKALSTLINLEVLEIQSSNISLIPYKAFNRNTNVRIIRFHNTEPSSSNHRLEAIGTKAFYKANRLEEINLANNHIRRIRPYAFEFNQKSLHELKIFLSGNQLHSDSFEMNALLGSNGRNITLYLGDYGNCNPHLITLKREIFEPFFEENPGNVVDMYGCPLVCDHRMEWLTYNLQRYRSHIRNLECLTSTQFMTRDNYHYYHVQK